MSGFAVVDVETTGLSPKANHRIAEIAIVQVSPAGEVESSWSTLVNPQRDLGAQWIHRIRRADVELAPTFDRITADVGSRLAGRVFVAHNASFDRAFVRAEFDRAGVRLPQLGVQSLCTMRWGSRLLPGRPRTLADCCRAAGIELSDAHQALADARATAQLLTHLFKVGGSGDDGWRELVEAAADTAWPAFPTTGAGCVHRGAATGSVTGAT